MTEENDKYLVKKYPKLFVNRYSDMKETCMCWGFECSDEWLWLIDNLCSTIQSYIDNNSKQKRIKNKYGRFFISLLKKLNRSNIKIIRKILPYKTIFKIEDKFEKETYEKISQVTVDQVKEKFGSLRFYFSGGDRLIEGMVWLAEHQSYSICEYCGTTKNVGHTKGWIYTCCEECSKTKDLKNWSI